MTIAKYFHFLFQTNEIVVSFSVMYYEYTGKIWNYILMYFFFPSSPYVWSALLCLPKYVLMEMAPGWKSENSDSSHNNCHSLRCSDPEPHFGRGQRFPHFLRLTLCLNKSLQCEYQNTASEKECKIFLLLLHNSRMYNLLDEANPTCN